MKDKNTFLVQRDFAYAFLCSRKFFLTFIIFLVVLIYFSIYPYKFMKEGVLILYGILFTNFFLLFTNYYSRSVGSYEISKANKTILIDGEQVELKKLESVQKIEAFGDIDTRWQEHLQTLLYASQSLFHYRFQYKNNSYVITCFMMSAQESDFLDHVFMGNYRVKKKFYPFVS